MKVSLHDLEDFLEGRNARRSGSSSVKDLLTFIRWQEKKERRNKSSKPDQITIPKFTVKHIMGFFCVFGIPMALLYIIVILKLLSVANSTAAGIFH